MAPSPVTYFVRMRALDGHAEEVEQLLLSNPRRIEEGEPGNLAFAVPAPRTAASMPWGSRASRTS